ncbi:MAG: metal-binding protein [Lachnospiraceae bacterium]|nr:metal-binding protein [Lachnospiraceae bacterium]
MSYKFFENKECEYYPCHKGIDKINCLFCYCPMYHIADCPGNPKYKLKDGVKVKVCTDCTFPHEEGHYEKVTEILKEERRKQGVKATEE